MVIQIIQYWIDQENMHCTSEQSGKRSYEADTEDGQVMAPKQKPMQSSDLPPELTLDANTLEHQFMSKLVLEDRQEVTFMRKGSVDTHYSILGFINRRILEKNRIRIMSEELRDLNE